MIIKQIFACYVCSVEETVMMKGAQWSFQLSFYFVFHSWGNHAKIFFLEEKFLSVFPFPVKFQVKIF